MAFKLVERKFGTVGLKGNELSINNYGATFGEDTAKRFDNFSYCEVFLDKEGRRVGFKPSNNSVNGFKVSKGQGKVLRKSISGSWAKQLPNKRYVVSYDEDMIIINDCDIVELKDK